MKNATPTTAERQTRVRRPNATDLSVCCMTSGHRPELLAGGLAALRGVADEIVVAVEEEHAEAVHDAVAGVADVVCVFPGIAPADRPLAWMFSRCSGTWIFNIDDDEVPSPALVAALPEIVRRNDITHAWFARRWLHPTAGTFVASRPWGNEFQLRLACADARFTQFSDLFHRPLACVGPSTFVDAPLWHLDTVLNPAGWRRRKASAYEAERAGMRIEGLAHNLGLYVPELNPELDLRPVPAADRRAIQAALAHRPSNTASGAPRVLRASAADVDRHWVGRPYPDSLYQAQLAFATEPTAMTAATQHTVDVRVTNDSRVTWRWGADGRPAIRLSYRWLHEGDEIRDSHALRTVLPVDVVPGATELVPVHVVPPELPGWYELEIDLVHEGVRSFGRSISTLLEVKARERVAFISPPERVHELVAKLDLHPSVEPLVLLRDLSDREAYGDFRSALGLRTYLLHDTEQRGRAGTLVRLLGRTLRIALRAQRLDPTKAEREPDLVAGVSAGALVVGGPNWSADAAFVREWWTVAATALVWRLSGRPVVIGDEALPDGTGMRPRAVRWALRRIRSSSGR